MNYKKTLKIFLRCGTYIFLMSRLFNGNAQFNIVFTIAAIKVLFDLILFDTCFQWLPPLPYPEDEIINTAGNIAMLFNLLFFAYFFAKICGLYKTFKDFKIWQKFLIFLLITILIFPVAMYDFKNFEVFKEFFKEENDYTTIIFSMFFVIPAFLLNLFFNFLTKKFPKPFECIGYYCSIEFFKDVFKRKKQRI